MYPVSLSAKSLCFSQPVLHLGTQNPLPFPQCSSCQYGVIEEISKWYVQKWKETESHIKDWFPLLQNCSSLSFLFLKLKVGGSSPGPFFWSCACLTLLKASAISIPIPQFFSLWIVSSYSALRLAFALIYKISFHKISQTDSLPPPRALIASAGMLICVIHSYWLKLWIASPRDRIFGDKNQRGFTFGRNLILHCIATCSFRKKAMITEIN